MMKVIQYASLNSLICGGTSSHVHDQGEEVRNDIL
jgi:hypothetical protein